MTYEVSPPVEADRVCRNPTEAEVCSPISAARENAPRDGVGAGVSPAPTQLVSGRVLSRP